MPHSIIDFEKVSKINLKGLSVVIPVLNENHLIIDNIKYILESFDAEVIVVDDGSIEPYPKAIKHDRNLGYGQAIMTGITHSSNEDILVMDGDGQHSIKDVHNLWVAWKLLNVDMLIGSRRLRSDSFIRLIGSNTINFIASCFAFRWIPDLNSGMRVFKKQLAMSYFSILCKGFSFTTSLTMSYMCDGYFVEWFPIKANIRKFGKSKVKGFKDGLVTLYYIIRIGSALRTRFLRSIKRRLFK